MIRIKLPKNYEALIDDEDFDLVNQYTWYLYHRKSVTYAITSIKDTEDKWKTVTMHQLILGKQPEKEIDHKKHNGLDNRRKNLRFCTTTENQQNQNKRITYGGKPCSSQYKGVTWLKDRKKWKASIINNGKSIFLGRFNLEKDAAMVYDKAALEYFGEFANLNFKEGVS